METYSSTCLIHFDNKNDVINDDSDKTNDQTTVFLVIVSTKCKANKIDNADKVFVTDDKDDSAKGRRTRSTVSYSEINFATDDISVIRVGDTNDHYFVLGTGFWFTDNVYKKIVCRLENDSRLFRYLVFLLKKFYFFFI